MSRRNTRQGKARRRSERDRRQVTERERKRPGTPDQGSRAVEDQAVQAAPRPDGSGPRNSDEHGSGLRPDSDGGLIAVDPGEADLDTDADLENAVSTTSAISTPTTPTSRPRWPSASSRSTSAMPARWPTIWPATSTGRKYRTGPKTPRTPSRASRPPRRTPRPMAPARRAPGRQAVPGRRRRGRGDLRPQ